jgi:hypothetical protein
MSVRSAAFVLLMRYRNEKGPLLFRVNLACACFPQSLNDYLRFLGRTARPLLRRLRQAAEFISGAAQFFERLPNAFEAGVILVGEVDHTAAYVIAVRRSS